MTRRRLAVLVGFALLAALGALARVVAPGQYEAAVDWGADIVDQTPEPVVLGVTVVAISVAIILVLVYVVRAYYWAWRQIRGPVTRFWNALLPESPIVRFGVGVTIMVLVFLIGPLIVLQTLGLFEDSDDPVEAQDDETDDDSDNTTDSENGDNGTANAHAADEPDSPDEPPDIS
jgi:Na+-transporting methylmalonyl-CoA/oxaloacetate decarboxylase gamma subunit